MGYKMVRIDKLGKVITGNTPSKNKKEYYNEATTPFIKPNNFNAVSISSLSESDEYLSHAGAKVGRLVEEGAVLVTCIGTIGSVGIANKEICFNQQINAVVPNEGIVNNRYLAYAIIKRREQLKAIANAPVVPIINKTQFSAFEIPLPPLETQKKIVEVLNKAQRLIDARKEQIRLMDELIQSVFYEMFSDPVTNPNEIHQVPLGELCNLKAGKFIQAAQISDLYEDNMYPCYGGNGLRGYVKEYTHDGSYPLIGRQGALCGNVQFAKGKFYATEHAIVTQPTVELDTIWLYVMLREMNLNRLATGAAQPGLNVSTLVSLQVIYPSINSQVEFANKFKEIEIQKALLKKSLLEIENNYYGLMQKAFSGKLF
ncbi:restriction endonuclease subunit S [Trichococcus shcherbakoviae]|uniref:Restriction endonuclease type i hsds n=1 Tax=Trichococcus shcherbakoviae TaxID=2094020 RepID=A0A383TI88_9LACT|nr:restriction endonuclease subunit S [Trichococcus shcherbakoviae]SYZ79835.1 restriction endonuclease type i hsds [Trichococcus shcherbakoviae]